MYETEAVVLRSIRYGEADSVLTLYTRERGRVSAIAKGTRKATSRLGGRLQPGVRVHLGLHEGRGEMAAVRQAKVVEPHAGLWVEGYRLRAAGSVLEATMRVLIEHEPNEGAYNLLCRGLALLATTAPRDSPPHRDPIVLGLDVKLLVVAGLLPRLGTCAGCGGANGQLAGADGQLAAGPADAAPIVAFSARLGGGLCARCASLGESVDAHVLEAFAGLVGRPLAEAADACPPASASGVERLVGLLLQEHLGVTLRSATPL